MNCELVQDLLPMYADSMLSASNADLVAGHINTCPTCRRQLAQMQAPVEDISIGKVIQDIMASRRKQAVRKGIITGILIAALLGLIVVGWLYLEFRSEYVKDEVVSTDSELILSEVPELTLTDAQIALGKRIFDLPEIVNALPAEGGSTNMITDIPQEISVAFPHAVDIQIDLHSVSVHCQMDGYFCMVIYYDGDLTGNADSITKYMNALRESKVPDTRYSVTYYPGLMETEYKKVEKKHVWFGFLRY